jgi:hypothetical protein
VSSKQVKRFLVDGTLEGLTAEITNWAIREVSAAFREAITILCDA